MGIRREEEIIKGDSFLFLRVMFAQPSFVRRVSLMTLYIRTFFTGRLVGTDSFGTRYYEQRWGTRSRFARRWAIYAGEPESTLIPPTWFGWLHHMTKHPMPETVQRRFVWQKAHRPNLSGTEASYLPARHFFWHLMDEDSPSFSKKRRWQVPSKK